MKKIIFIFFLLNSVMQTQTVLKQVTFRFQPVISGVNRVFLAGTFNDWSDSRNEMTDPDADGIYEITLLLRPGIYQYKFVADGSWISDQEAEAYADEGRGEPNAIITETARMTRPRSRPSFKRS